MSLNIVQIKCMDEVFDFMSEANTYPNINSAVSALRRRLEFKRDSIQVSPYKEILELDLDWYVSELINYCDLYIKFFRGELQGYALHLEFKQNMWHLPIKRNFKLIERHLSLSSREISQKCICYSLDLFRFGCSCGGH